MKQTCLYSGFLKKMGFWKKTCKFRTLWYNNYVFSEK